QPDEDDQQGRQNPDDQLFPNGDVSPDLADIRRRNLGLFYLFMTEMLRLTEGQFIQADGKYR
ncbi:MAG TPA: hypothetical protein VK206_22390, partial [Anaerolineales bacterium]|nr:hypothetical protein [Anaerolineales bacterium]